MRHEVNDEEQQHTEHRAGEALGDALGDVRHEDDERASDDRAGQPADAAEFTVADTRNMANLIR
jgi:hypothetical protein